MPEINIFYEYMYIIIDTNILINYLLELIFVPCV